MADPLPTLVLTQRQVRQLLTMDAAVTAVEAAFLAHGRGEALMPPKVYVELPEHGGDFRAMPSFLAGAAGVKWINSHPGSPAKHGLPAVIGLYVLSDPDTGMPLAIMDATHMTALRTGASAAVATKFLGPKAPKTLGLVGAGVQAGTLVAAHRVLFPEIEVVAHDVSEAAAQALVDEVGHGRVGSLAEACACAVVCTSTPVRQPVVPRDRIAAGTHINAMGADAEGKQELDPQILKDAAVFVDDVPQASHSGEINVPLHDGSLSPEDLAGTLGEVVAGRRPGRPSAEAITVFDSTGLALQDTALARVVHEAARAQGLGVPVSFLD
jgi:ornithine cyclodeaminase/alanine dehydrogenase